jgi:hypothetical protein
MLSMILNVILWIWGVEVAAAVLIYCVTLGKGHWAYQASKPSL